MAMLSQVFSVIIDCGISAPRHGRKVVDGLNSIDKRFLLQLMSTVQLTGGKVYNTQMFMHTRTHTSDVGLAREFQKHLSTAACKNGVIV